MVGPFKIARGGMAHMLVAVDKFTKWIEANLIKKLNGLTAVTFIADITIRYGIPHSIIVDNDTNFAIRLDLVSVPIRRQTAKSKEKIASFCPASSPN